MTKERVTAFVASLVVAAFVSGLTLLALSLQKESRCKKARQAYFDAGYYAAVTRDADMIQRMTEYRAKYEVACRDR